MTVSDTILTTLEKQTELEQKALEKQVRELLDQSAESKLDPTRKSSSQEAQRHHEKLVAATRLGKTANIVIREEAVELFLSGGYQQISVPYPDDPQQKLSFDNFHAYIHYIAETEGISEATASGLYNFIVNVVQPVSSGLITAPETGQPYKVEEVLNMREGHLQSLASAANSLKDAEFMTVNGEKVDITERDKRDILGELISVARDKTNTRYDLTTAIEELGLKTRRFEPFEVKVAYVENKAIFQIILPKEMEIRVNIALQNRAEIYSTTLKELMEELKALVPEEEIRRVEESKEVTAEDWDNFTNKLK